MTSEGLLGIDLGTGSVKAVVSSLSGEVRGVASCEYPVLSPQDGWAESDPGQWWTGTVAAVRRVLADAPVEVVGIGLSGQMHGVTIVDADGLPLRAAILHADGRSVAELAAYRRLDDRQLARLANPLSPNMAGPMLCWLRRHEPSLLARARWALQPKDWVRLQLVGEVATDPSDASATLLYDVPGDRWDGELLAALGIDPALLPPVAASSGNLAGGLAPRAAAELGLPAGVPVAVGAADTAAGALGTGLCLPGQTQLTIGTSAQVICMLGRPGAAPGVHCYRTATPVSQQGPTGPQASDVPSSWYAMGAVLNAGLALNWVRTVLGASWQEVYAAAASPGHPHDPLFLPQLTGERTPYLDPSMRGAWTGLSLASDRTALLRAALEGVAFSVRRALDALPPGGHPVRLVGGGTTDPAWRQMLADILGRPLAPYDVPVASGRGAALLGGLAAGALSWADVMPAGDADVPESADVAYPRPEACAAYDPRRARFEEHVQALRGSGEAG